MSQDSFEFSVFWGPLRVGGSGKVAPQVGDKVMGALEPYLSTVGSAGDNVNRFLARKSTAQKQAIEEATRLREADGTNGRPVNQKLLTQWMDGSGEEDPNGENVTKLWAELLRVAPEAYSAEFSFFINVLRRIGPSEAQLFARSFVLPGLLPDDWSEVSSRAFHQISDALGMYNDSATYTDFEHRVAAVRKVAMGELGDDVGFYPTYVVISNGKFYDRAAVGQMRGDYFSLKILENAGLIESDAVTIPYDYFQVRIEFFYPSFLGIKFAETISLSSGDYSL